MIKKQCTKCKKKKTFDSFQKDKYGKFGISPQCKKCKAEYNCLWSARNEEKRKKAGDKWLSNNSEYRKIVSLRSHLRKKYGMSLEEFEILNKKQKGLCLICGKKESNKRFKRLSVDHCHKTERVRGLLCTNCNGILGLANDNVELLKKCINYLIVKIK